MNYMKKLVNYLSLISLFIMLDFIEAQGETSNKTILMQENLTKDLGPPILKPNHFSMNQSFSLSTSFSNNVTQTIGIFSNFTNHELSEKLNFKTGFHLIQNKNHSTLPHGHEMGFGYDIGLEYKITPNSLFSLQISNYNNRLKHQHINPLIDVP